jgi:RNA polymerase sigma-70 factor (ECF subfamily)
LGGRDGEEDTLDPISQLADPHGRDPEGLLNVAQLGERLTAALSELPHRQQQTFMLRAWQGFSVAETAHAMKCTDGTIKTHYSRAISNLRKQLGDLWP